MLTPLPFARLVFETDLTVDQVTARLSAQVEPAKWFRWSREHLPFEGWVEENRFAIRRIIHYRNSFLPRLHGRVTPSDRGATVTIYMYPHAVVLVFLAAGFTGLGYGTLHDIQHALRGNISVSKIILPLLMLLFGYGLPMVCFIPEAIKAKNLLVPIVAADGNAPNATAPAERKANG